MPSYLWLEPEATVEQVGVGCLAAAMLSVVSWGISARRGLRAIALSIRYERYCRRLGQETQLDRENTRVWVIEDAAGLFALAGIFHPRLVISREVLQNLSAVELEAALRHERAHGTSHDNLKRLLLLLAPNILPFSMWGGLASLERGWAQFAEWAADDNAVNGDSRRAVSLAGALVRVANMGVLTEASPLMTSLVADGRDLEARVNRLLGAAPGGEYPDQPTEGAGRNSPSGRLSRSSFNRTCHIADRASTPRTPDPIESVTEPRPEGSDATSASYRGDSS